VTAKLAAIAVVLLVLPASAARASLHTVTAATFMHVALPGANGIKIRRGAVYVSNTSTKKILAIPMRADGSAGKIAVRFSGFEADDFAFAADGDLYIAENPPSKLVRIAPGGSVTTLAANANGLQNPSAVAFGTRPRQRRWLYVTNSAYFGTHPSLGRIVTRTPGQRLP
jgi:sugar lactone lactonase YvrE